MRNVEKAFWKLYDRHEIVTVGFFYALAAADMGALVELSDRGESDVFFLAAGFSAVIKSSGCRSATAQAQESKIAELERRVEDLESHQRFPNAEL